MIKNCPVCRKAFEVLYPDLWRYKRDKTFLCSWGCMRALDDKKGVNKDMALTKAQKQAVIEMLLNGENPNEFIKNCGIKNPTCTVWNLKQYLKKYDRETWDKLQPKPEIPEKTVAVEVPEGVVKGPVTPDDMYLTISSFHTVKDVSEVPEIKPAYEKRYTAVETPAGDFQYFRRNGYLDWTPLDGNGTVSLKVEEWKEFLRIFPLMAADLGVEM